MASQTTPPDISIEKRNDLQRRLEEYEKNLRKMIFDNTPKKANWFVLSTYVSQPNLPAS